MKYFLPVVALFFSVNCFADYFICRITVNGQSREESAEYRGRETSVTLAPYICAGKMVDRLVTTSISDNYFGLIVQNQGDMSSTSTFTDQSFKGEPLDEVICHCGLN